MEEETKPVKRKR